MTTATTTPPVTSTSPTYFIGVWGNNTLTGYGVNEVFYAPGGKGVMTGAGVKNTYIADGNTQSMEVTNFNPSHDVLTIFSSTGVSSLSGLLAHTKVTSSGLEIDFSSGSKILLDGVASVSALNASNFVFSQGAYTPPNTNVPLSALTSTTPTYFIEPWGNHTVTGSGATELFFAPGGTELLTGGGSKNIYVVDSNTNKMEITNFNPAHDVLYIGSSSGIDSLPTMMSHLKTTSSGSLEIDLPSGAQIVLDGVHSVDSLSTSNVAFYAGAYTPPASTTPPPTTPPVTPPTTTQQRIIGTAGNDVLKGGAAPDFFYGNGGTDVMTGGSVRNQFIVDNLNHRVEITNFNPSHDMLYLGSSTGVTNLSGLLATGHATSQGTYEFNTPSGTTIVFDNITSASYFTANDMGFFSGTYAAATAGGDTSGGGTSSGGSTTPAQLPLAGAANARLNTNAWIPASSIYAATLPQGSNSSIVSVKFTDTSAGGIHFDYAGGPIIDNSSVSVSPSSAGSLHLDAGTTPGDYTFQVAVMDAQGHWSAPATGHVTVVGIAAAMAIG